mmetsp:Transcript_17018/g.55673  ORF Transcript_17018/g.55673 Transcript_17018/m.55673 type:complete len:213 (+) Transcript_17018:666-1304(+)
MPEVFPRFRVFDVLRTEIAWIAHHLEHLHLWLQPRQQRNIEEVEIALVRHAPLHQPRRVEQTLRLANLRAIVREFPAHLQLCQSLIEEVVVHLRRVTDGMAILHELIDVVHVIKFVVHYSVLRVLINASGPLVQSVVLELHSPPAHLASAANLISLQQLPPPPHTLTIPCSNEEPHLLQEKHHSATAGALKGCKRHAGSSLLIPSSTTRYNQ